ncbi:diguanylate cyclase [Chryseomicrobium palamuruense]|uniref:Diguanylate cyclase n=1 Tax=Chryseomicrobium palamuruense TaxID=682973 RepID=A0ABV8UW21_9BACL
MATVLLEDQLKDIWSHVHSDSKQAMRNASALIKQLDPLTDKLLIAKTQVTLAYCYGHEGDNAEALDLVNRSTQIIKDAQDIEWHVNANRVTGFVYASLGDLKQASDAFEEGLVLMKEHKMPIDPYYLNNLGFIYYELGEYEQAYHQILGAMEVAREQQHDIVPLLLSNLADLQLLFGNIEEAEGFNNEAFHLLKKQPHQKASLAQCYSIYGLIARERKEWSKSLEYLQKTLELNQEMNSKYSQAATLLDIGMLYSVQNDYEAALDYLIQALELSDSIQATLLQRDILEKMAETFKQTGDFEEAYYHLKRFNEVNEQIRTKEVQDQISRLMTEMKVEQMQKDAEIENLKLKRLSEQAKVRAEVLEESYQDLITISEIGRRIIANQENAEVLYTVHKDLNKLMEAHIFGLCIYNKSKQEVEYRAFVEQGHLVTLSNKSIHDPKSLSVHCIRENKEVHIVKGVAMQDYTPRETGIESRNPQSLHFFPLVMNEDVIGAITIQSYQSNAFSERQIEMLRILALYVSIAMSNVIKSEQLREQTKKLEEMTKKDSLTNLYNLRHMKSLLKDAMETFHKTHTPFSIIVIDLDHFKEINDSYGHSCGDHVLQEVSRHFLEFARQEDVVARWGGEEFLILLPNTPLEEARVIGEALRELVEDLSILYQHMTVEVTATLGVATYSSRDWHVDELIERADKALYIGKEAGRNQVVVYGSE